MSSLDQSKSAAHKAATSLNADAVSNQGAFHASIRQDLPQQTSGHQPGRIVSPKDRAETFHAQCIPPGTAPKDRTFKPNNLPDGMPPGKVGGAMDGMPGATSADVYQGKGHPGNGMTSREHRHNGQAGGKKEGTGLSRFKEGGPGGLASGKLDPGQRAMGKERAREDHTWQRTEKTEHTALDSQKETC